MKNTVPLPPDGLDLGNLDDVKVGDELALVSLVNGKARTLPHITKVRLLEPHRVLTEKGGWLRQNKGGRAVMCGPPLYYSANPQHIALANAKLRAQARIAIRKRHAEQQRLEEFRVELQTLLDKYGVSLHITYGPDSDTHGIYDEKIEACLGSESVVIESFQ